MTHKYIYEVIVKSNDDPTTPDAFAGINFGKGGYSELVDLKKDGRQIYAIYTDNNIDSALDSSNLVESYRVADGYGNCY